MERYVNYDRKTQTATCCYKTFNLKGWNIRTDNDSYMLECPRCECRMNMEHYLIAIGQLGTKYCPYCGLRIEQDIQTSIFDYMTEDNE